LLQRGFPALGQVSACIGRFLDLPYSHILPVRRFPRSSRRPIPSSSAERSNCANIRKSHSGRRETRSGEQS
jgi:hypothetical protein